MIKLENVKSPFMCYCAKVIPLAFDESMSYYECLCNFYNYLKNEIMPAINNNAEATTELQNKFIELKNYIDNYFENLDVQDEINNKLDEMAESGELADIIGQYIQLQYVKIFDNVADMKIAENLVNGDTVLTNGYYSANDGGSAYYKIRPVTTDDTIDDMFIIRINETLIAELQYNNKLKYLQVGGKINDNTYDSSEILQLLIDKLYEKKAGKIYLPCGQLYLQNTVTLKSNIELIGFGDYSVWNYNDDEWQDKITTLYYNGSNNVDLFITNTSDTSQGNYQPNINLKNLYIVGNSSVTNGLNLIGITKSNIENITIIGCQNNIRISRGMTTNFKSIYSQQASNHCLLIDAVNGTNTTLNFYDCYFGQTRTSNGNPLTITTNTLLNGNFIDCVFESSNNSIEIDSKNDINFNNLYVENIPETENNPTFKIGNTDPDNIDKGNINFIGGCIMGSNSTLSGSMCIFDINYISNLTLINTPLKRSNYSIKLNQDHTGLITCIGINETQITYGINYYKNSEKIAYFNCNNNSVTLNEKTYIPKMTLPKTSLTLENSWTNYGNGCSYLKFGNFVIIDINATAGTVLNGTTITTLPEEVRPINQVFFSLFNLSDGATTTVPIKIGTNGKITVTTTGLTTAKVHVGTVIFLTN